MRLLLNFLLVLASVHIQPTSTQIPLTDRFLSSLQYSGGINDEELRNNLITYADLSFSHISSALQSLEAEESVQCYEQLWYIKRVSNSTAEGKAMYNKMVDAWGKPEGGILQGNWYWLGRASECRHVTFPRLDSPTIHTRQSLVGFTLGHSRLPLTQGACLPHSCDEQATATVFHTIAESLGIERVEVHSVTFEQDGEYNAAFGLAVAIFGILLITVAVGTGLDLYVQHSKDQLHVSDLTNGDANINDDLSGSEQVSSGYKPLDQRDKIRVHLESNLGVKCLLAFSLYTNVPKLISTKSGPDTIKCLNGIRVISIAWVVAGHTCFYALQGNPAVYVSNLVEWYGTTVNRFSFMLIANCSFSVDSFFVLSAFLLTYLTLKKLSERGDRGVPAKFWVMYVLQRYWRLTPSFVLVILFTVGIWQLLGNETVVQWQPWLDEVRGCHSSWWVNLLYLNNIVHTQPEQLCLGWTWYLANDFQFYLIAPFLVVPMYKMPRVGLGATLALTLVSCGACFGISFGNNLPPGGTTTIINPKANLVYNTDYDALFVELYIRPYSRFCSYGVGMLLGYLVYLKPPGTFRMPRWANLLGWFLSLGVLFAVIFGIFGVTNGHFPSRTAAAFYNGLSRPAWSLGLSWVMFACLHGYGGPVNTLLSLDVWIPVGKLTYMVYLIHILIIQFLYTTYETTVTWNAVVYATTFTSNVVLSFAVAFVLVLLFESPIIQLERVLLKR